jgi:hypothetical protein
VQNNGSGAAQLISHPRFDTIPRYPIDHTPHKIELVLDGMKATNALFGRGQRHYRDDDDAERLVKVILERNSRENTTKRSL